MTALLPPALPNVASRQVLYIQVSPHLCDRTCLAPLPAVPSTPGVLPRRGAAASRSASPAFLSHWDSRTWGPHAESPQCCSIPNIRFWTSPTGTKGFLQHGPRPTHYSIPYSACRPEPGVPDRGKCLEHSSCSRTHRNQLSSAQRHLLWEAALIAPFNRLFWSSEFSRHTVFCCPPLNYRYLCPRCFFFMEVGSVWAGTNTSSAIPSQSAPHPWVSPWISAE